MGGIAMDRGCSSVRDTHPSRERRVEGVRGNGCCSRDRVRRREEGEARQKTKVAEGMEGQSARAFGRATRRRVLTTSTSWWSATRPSDHAVAPDFFPSELGSTRRTPTSFEVDGRPYDVEGCGGEGCGCVVWVRGVLQRAWNERCGVQEGYR